MDTETQASRTSTVGASVTEQEKWAVELVRRKTGKPISELLREHTLTELIEMGGRLDQALNALSETAA